MLQFMGIIMLSNNNNNIAVRHAEKNWMDCYGTASSFFYHFFSSLGVCGNNNFSERNLNNTRRVFQCFAVDCKIIIITSLTYASDFD